MGVCCKAISSTFSLKTRSYSDIRSLPFPSGQSSLDPTGPQLNEGGGFGTLFALVAILVMAILLGALMVVTIIGVRLSRSSKPSTIRRVPTVTRGNPYSDTCMSLSRQNDTVLQNGLGIEEKVSSDILLPLPLSAPTLPEHASPARRDPRRNPGTPCRPRVINGLPHLPSPSAVPEVIKSYDNARNLAVDTTQSIGDYDVLTCANMDRGRVEGSSVVPTCDQSPGNSFSLSMSLTHSSLRGQRSHGYGSAGLLRSYSESQKQPLHDHTYCENLEPSMLRQKEGPGTADDPQVLPFAPIYDYPKPLRRNERPAPVVKDNIIEIRDLGVGQFGQVVLAATRGLSPKDLRLGTSIDRTRSLLVAIKKLKPYATENLRKSFECEIKFMSRLKHSNVVRLLGACEFGEPFLMMEYMENGDLHGFLCKHKLVPDSVDFIKDNEITPLILMYIAVQIANGMRYLASQRFVHRDLATRNCLVGRDFVVKISDFGMSCSLYQSFYYCVQGRLILPIRWMAFESFYGKFSVKSDAWSYGVTVWEVFTLAQTEPYSDMSDEEVIADAIRGGNRTLLPKPPMCPNEVYNIMLRCWVHEPVIRADFEEVYSRMFLLYTRMSNQTQ